MYIEACKAGSMFDGILRDNTDGKYRDSVFWCNWFLLINNPSKLNNFFKAKYILDNII